MGWSFDEYSTRRRGDAEGRRKNLHAETRRSRRKDIFERNTKKIPLSAFSASPREPLFPAPGRDQPGPAGEEFLHHGLFEQAGLVPPLLQGRQFRVHVGQDFGDGGLFNEIRKGYLQVSNVTAIDCRVVRAGKQCFNLPADKFCE